ncbi:MAG: hydrogenase nickel incorporation protein HypA [Firmicutes bacterium HGW-Firmicutes-20]|jgi:hydrogenase nickel incorporation protein HypA/HybF|nr:MAG: hydrogenase nickel incorporation protein HypA [Firmicutes bacterium HGW-Firmicutes-20]
MHEIGVLEEAVRTVERIAKDKQIDKIRFVTLEIGELTGYLPVFFEKYFPVIVENRPALHNAELHMQIVKGEAICTECQSLYNVIKNEGCCPSCKSRSKKILGGQEFLIKDIGY